MLYPPGEALRESCYLWRRDETAIKERALIRPWIENMVDMPTALEVLLAFTIVVMEDAPEAVLDMAEKLGVPFTHTRVFTQLLKSRKSDLYRLIKRSLERAYISLTGVSYQEEKIDTLSSALRGITAQIGIENLITALNEIAVFSHVLVPPAGGETSAYLELVKEKISALYASIWKTGRPPIRQWAIIWLEESKKAK